MLKLGKEDQMRKSKYNQEFKDSTVKLCIDSDKSITSIARDLGLNKGTLSLWVNKYKDDNNIRSKSSTFKESLEEENKRLKKELSIAKQERDILKKATAYFAKETI
jgi:transposase